MTRSETINDLAAALAKAQGEIHGAAKDSVNPHFKSKYADLASIWDACRAPLSKNGLSIVQAPGYEGDCVTLTTTLLHVSGQFIAAELSVPISAPTAQSMGSALTYLRRYSLAAMVGVAPEDDDGNAASGPGEQRTMEYVNNAAASRPVSVDENGEVTLPFGKSKGTPLSKMTTPDLESALDWAAHGKGKGRYPGFESDAAAEIARRKAKAAAIQNQPMDEKPLAIAAGESDDLPY